jgi:hypothetical protein
MRNRFSTTILAMIPATMLATLLTAGMALTSGSVRAQGLNAPCSHPEIERICAAQASRSWACPLSLEAIGGRASIDLRQRLATLAQAKNSPPESAADLMEARVLSCGLGAVDDTDTARLLLQNTVVALHRTFSQRPQGSTLLVELGNLIVVQFDLGFRTDALYSLALFDELSGRARPLDALIDSHIELAGHLAAHREWALADRYFLSAETLATVMPKGGTQTDPALLTLLRIADVQRIVGAFDRAAHNLNRLEASIPYAALEPSASASLKAAIADQRARLR